MKRTLMDIPRDGIYRLLGPCPLVMVSARAKGAEAKKAPGRLRLCTVAWCMPLDYDPPKAAIVMGADHATTKAAISSGELVLNVPTAELADQVFGVGSRSSLKVDKCSRFGLTPLPSKVVAAEGIAECAAVLECRILEGKSSMGRRLRKQFDLLLLEIVHARADRKLFSSRWKPERGASLLSHLGGDLFGTARAVLRARVPRA